jgi:choline-sulfatase
MLTRRNFLSTATAAGAPWVARAQARRWNVLFLMSDQHQRGAAGCYGHGEVKTPGIDRLAERATRFDAAYCNSPVCVPARGSMLTGLYPHAHGARILKDALPETARTVAHFFRERGYRTGAIGKMHFVDETRRHGFDHRLNEGDFAKTLTAEERAALRKDQGGAGDVEGRPSGLESRYFQDDWFAGESVKFLRENRDAPFVLWSSYLMPHTPLVPMRRYWEMYDPAELRLPHRPADALTTAFEGHLIRAKERGWYQQSEEACRRGIAGYYGNISQMDSCVERVYGALEELGLLEKTVVVYTSDHGEMAGAHRMWTKHNMFEQSVGVPLLVSLPGQKRAGAGRRELIEHVDLFPTLAELCGFEAPRGLHGRSFAGLLENRAYGRREFVYAEYDFCHNVFTRDDRYVGRDPIRMVRTERWKLNDLSWGRPELYDLEKDPAESRNVAAEAGNAGIVRELRGMARRQAGLPAAG